MLPAVCLSQKDAVWHSRRRCQLQPSAWGASRRVCLGRRTAPWRINMPSISSLIVRSLPKTFPQRDEEDKHGLCFWRVCLVMDEECQTTKTDLEETICCLCMLALIILKNSCWCQIFAPRLLERTQASAGTLDGGAFELGWCCLHLRQEISTYTCIYKRKGKMETVKYIQMASPFFISLF